MVKSRDLGYEKEIGRHIDDMISVLKIFQAQDEYAVQDYLAIERALQVLIESLIGLGRYVLKIGFERNVSKSGEVFDELVRHKAMTVVDHGVCRQMVGYRNVLVHDYLNVNPAITRSIVETGEFEKIRELATTLLHNLSAFSE